MHDHRSTYASGAVWDQKVALKVYLVISSNLQFPPNFNRIPTKTESAGEAQFPIHYGGEREIWLLTKLLT